MLVLFLRQVFSPVLITNKHVLTQVFWSVAAWWLSHRLNQKITTLGNIGNRCHVLNIFQRSKKPIKAHNISLFRAKHAQRRKTGSVYELRKAKLPSIRAFQMWKTEGIYPLIFAQAWGFDCRNLTYCNDPCRTFRFESCHLRRKGNQLWSPWESKWKKRYDRSVRFDQYNHPS